MLDRHGVQYPATRFTLRYISERFLFICSLHINTDTSISKELISNYRNKLSLSKVPCRRQSRATSPSMLNLGMSCRLLVFFTLRLLYDLYPKVKLSPGLYTVTWTNRGLPCPAGNRNCSFTRKQRIDVGKYSFVRRSIKSINQLPVGLLASFPCKLNTFRKRVKNVVTSKGIQVGNECK
jgi:hypothetical protein